LKNYNDWLANKRYNWHGIKKSLDIPINQRLQMIEKENLQLSIYQQCQMVNIARSSYYDYIQEPTMKEKAMIERIETIYNKRPEYGSRRVRDILRRQGTEINRKKVQRIMRVMNIQGVCPKQNLSIHNHEHKKYPYIARQDPIVQIDQVWSTDITYVKTRFGTVYLAAIIDWHSRLILAWNMSNNMSEEFCIETLEKALKRGTPQIFNTDQGSQFTGAAFLKVLTNKGIKPSMDGKGRATDNAHIERFWRSVKWEEVYLHEPQSYQDLQKMIGHYIKFYNHERPHQSLDYKTPSEAHLDLEKKNFDFEARPIYTEKELRYMLTL
jgi:putative transposase